MKNEQMIPERASYREGPHHYYPKPVPEELQQFFETASALGDRWGLPRFEWRFRVVEVEADYGPPDDPRIIKGDTYECKTHAAAVRKKQAMTKEGKTTLIQQAIVFWMAPDEWPHADRFVYNDDDEG